MSERHANVDFDSTPTDRSAATAAAYSHTKNTYIHVVHKITAIGLGSHNMIMAKNTANNSNSHGQMIDMHMTISLMMWPTL